MRRIILLMVALVATSFAAFADNDKPISVDQLPAPAKQFISTYFADSNVAYAKMETKLYGNTYEVVFADGKEVEFNADGQWKEVKCKYSEVPAGIVPQQIREYVSTNYNDAKITKIERDKRDYEVKLSNGLELTFDLKFNLIEIDD